MTVHQKLLPKKSKIYSAPRRFDLATLFVVTILYSLLFGILTAIEVHPGWIIGIATFLSAIGVAQAALFQGKKPRLASMIAGGIVLPTMMGVLILIYEPDYDPWVASIQLIFTAGSGLAMGYLCGTLVGGVFMFAEMLRKGGGVE
jgi:hypothetical protein